MEKVIRKQRIETLQSLLTMLKIECNGYAEQFDDETLDQKQKSEIAHRWDAALKERRSLQSTLNHLEQEERVQTPS